MTSLSIVERQGQLVVDSRLIAAELGITHEGFIKTLRKFESKIEQRFGIIRFEIGEIDGRGRPEKYALLTEPQATTLMTFSRNTDQVVECKLKLVEAFEKAKRVIKEVLPQKSDRIQELELENRNLAMALEMRRLDHTMLQLHGAPVVLALRGKDDQVVEVERPTIEVIDQNTNVKFKGMTTKQLADYVSKTTGYKFKSGAEVERTLKDAGREDLIAQTKRSVLQDYIPDEFVKEAVKVLTSGTRQLLLGE